MYAAIYSTQQCLIPLIEKWKSVTDKGKSFGALQTDLSKDFECLPHEFLIAKLHAYGSSLAALGLVRSYLSSRKQRTKINESYSSWDKNFIWSITRIYFRAFIVKYFYM